MAAKAPKKTIAKILDISLQLFNASGFENVKMQDIVDKLAQRGFTKGAIYHHFKNKEDILSAIFMRFEQPREDIFSIERSQMNGRDKLKCLILAHLSHKLAHKEMLRASSGLLGSLRALGHKEQQAHTHFAPIVESMIEEGNSDGSLNVAYVKACAQMLAWGIYVWLDSALYPLSQAEYTHKVRHLRIMCEGVGLSVIDEEVNATLLEVWHNLVGNVAHTSA